VVREVEAERCFFSLVSSASHAADWAGKRFMRQKTPMFQRPGSGCKVKPAYAGVSELKGVVLRIPIRFVDANGQPTDDHIYGWPVIDVELRSAFDHLRTTMSRSFPSLNVFKPSSTQAPTKQWFLTV
jgi:hypothetical protein